MNVELRGSRWIGHVAYLFHSLRFCVFASLVLSVSCAARDSVGAKLTSSLWLAMHYIGHEIYSDTDLTSFTQLPMRRYVYVLQMFFFVFFVFFLSAKNMRQPFSGTAERIFMKLLPNDTGKNGV